MLVVSRFVRLGGFSSFSFFLFALAHFRSLPLAWWFCISALRGFSCSSVAVILLLLMKYVLRHVREKKILLNGYRTIFLIPCGTEKTMPFAIVNMIGRNRPCLTP